MKRALVIVAIAFGCGTGSDKTADTATSEKVEFDKTPITSAAPGPESVKPSGTCPHDGQWALCSVENRLRQSGFVVKPVDEKPVKRAGFSITPKVYTLGKSRLEVFIYKDPASLARDIASLDTLRVAPLGDTTSRWDTQPVLIRSANLAAVLLSTNARQVERVALALTAGAPQPGSPR